MIPHDCTRQVELVAFIECNQPTSRSGWFLDYFYTDRRTRAEKLAIRNYSKASALPLLYTGACQPPTLVSPPVEGLALQELTWPVIKAEAPITGCDVDDRRILPNGDIIPVGMQRFNEALMHGMSGLVDGLRATHINEAINLLKTGSYVVNQRINGVITPVGTVDFRRNAAISGIDLTGTGDDWTNPCARPHETIEAIAREMARCGGLAGGIDIVYGHAAWRALEAHQERDLRNKDFTGSRVEVGTSLLSIDQTMVMSFNDVTFKGTTNGGQIRHWVSHAKYFAFDGTEQDVVAPGEIMVVSPGGFGGQRIFRTVTSDNREELPDGALPFFLYDDLEEEYNRKCRSFNPWIEEYHLFVPQNVNGAAIAQVVEDDAEICVPCAACPDTTPVVNALS